MKAAGPDYAVGFGPTLWKKKIGETPTRCVILLGGYVKIIGMYAPARAGTRLVGRSGKPTLAEARQGSRGGGRSLRGGSRPRVPPAERAERRSPSCWAGRS